MDKKSENGKNHKKKTPAKFVPKSEEKKVENSEIGPDSETLTSNTRVSVDLRQNGGYGGRTPYN